MKRFPPLRYLVVLAGLAIALLQTACIEFDRQIMSYRLDAKADTLLIFQNYLGIYGGDNENVLSDQEVAQLRSVLEGERTFFFYNWIFELNVSQLEQTAGNLGEDQADSDRERALYARARKAVKTLRENLTINNGPFYLDPEGRLSGVQMVRITKLTKVVTAVNDGIRAMLQRNLLVKDLDPEERRLTERALAERRPYLTVEGNRISFRYPMTGEGFRRDFAKPESGDADLRRLRAAGISVTHENGEFRASVGKVEDRVTRVAMDTFEKPYRENALHHTQQARIAVEPEYDAARATREFLGAE